MGKFKALREEGRFSVILEKNSVGFETVKGRLRDRWVCRE